MAGRKARHFRLCAGLAVPPAQLRYDGLMSMDRAKAEALVSTLDGASIDRAFRSGLDLIAADFPELLLPAVAGLARRHRADARMAQLVGLAARAVGDGPLAYRSFRRAARLAPNDPLIAHSHARTALEAGHPAVGLFTSARQLSPQDGAILTGLAAALVGEGRHAEADILLADILKANPAWADGHRALAQVRGQFGGDVTSSVTEAIRLAPRDAGLHALSINLLLQARQPDAAADACRIARTQLGEQPWIALLHGHALSEMGDYAAADLAFSGAAKPGSVADASLLIRHSLRCIRVDTASSLLEAWLPHDAENVLTPYASIVWRLKNDPRAEWLEGEKSLVGVYDLAREMGDLPGLARRLRALHHAISPPIDQSVRGGTQTDGNLLLRDDPAIQRLRTLLLETVAKHVAQMASARSDHPTLIARRAPVRIVGSWSVRLQDAGFHADHVHTHGWLSSALYISLPPSLGASDGDNAGWLSLGESREVAPSLAPFRLIEPKPGRLVLFPSTMWHGTRPFPKGERLTIAFDIARPRQD